MKFLLFFLLIFSSLVAKEEIATGIFYESREEKGLVVHLLEVDPAQAAIEIIRASDETLLAWDTPSTIAAENNAVAAINGGFYRGEDPFAGTPSGLLMIDNTFLGTPRHLRASIGWNAKGEHVVIDRVSVEAKVHTPTRDIPIAGINLPRLKGEYSVYTDRFAKKTVSDPSAYKWIISEEGLITKKTRDPSVEIPRGGFVVVGPDVPNLENGPAELEISLFPASTDVEQWEAMQYILGGAGLLVQNGKMIDDFSSENTLSSFIDGRYCRTAVGVLENHNFLFVVIESPAVRGGGMTLYELAKFMHDEKCVDALNLDGGGSSTMVIENRVVNTPCGPSDDSWGKWGEERKVGEIIAIFSKKGSV